MGVFSLRAGGKMSVKKPKTKEVELTKYIWSLKGKCEGITEVNKELINQYVRFSMMAEDLSIKMKHDFDTGNFDSIEDDMKLYEKVNKTVLGLRKTLSFEQIKDELAAYEDNPYKKLIKEEAEADDL